MLLKYQMLKIIAPWSSRIMYYRVWFYLQELNKIGIYLLLCKVQVGILALLQGIVRDIGSCC